MYNSVCFIAPVRLPGPRGSMTWMVTNCRTPKPLADLLIMAAYVISLNKGLFHLLGFQNSAFEHPAPTGKACFLLMAWLF
jgi:hypothetical protein